MLHPCVLTPRSRRCFNYLHAIPCDRASPVGAPQLYLIYSYNFQLFFFIYIFSPCIVTPGSRRCPDCLHAVPRDRASPVGAPQLYLYLNK